MEKNYLKEQTWDNGRHFNAHYTKHANNVENDSFENMDKNQYLEQALDLAKSKSTTQDINNIDNQVVGNYNAKTKVCYKSRRMDNGTLEIVIYHYTGNLPEKKDIMTYYPVKDLKKLGNILVGSGATEPIPLEEVSESFLLQDTPISILNEQLLKEDNRHQLIQQAKQGANYRGDQSKGKNRYARRVHSSLANTTKEYNQINMNKLFKENILDVNIKVRGETDDYLVRISFGNFLDELKSSMKNSEFNLRNVLRSLISCFNHDSVYISCSCPDYKYRHAHLALKKNISSKSAKDWIDQGDSLVATKAPDITNPNDDLGPCCKHVALVLNNTSWLIKVASVINNYVNYMKDNYEDLYQRIIYPHIYGKRFDAENRLDVKPEVTAPPEIKQPRNMSTIRPGEEPIDEVPSEEQPIEEPTDEIPQEQPSYREPSRREKRRNKAMVSRDDQRWRNLDLDTDQDVLDRANDYGRTRTQFKRGNTQGVRFAPKRKLNPVVDTEYDGPVGSLLR